MMPSTVSERYPCENKYPIAYGMTNQTINDLILLLVLVELLALLLLDLVVAEVALLAVPLDDFFDDDDEPIVSIFN
jgi:hypothetical protein